MEEETKPQIDKTSIRRCPRCHQDVEVKTGFSKDNFKNLFRKPTMEEWVTLFIMILAVSSFFVYRMDINAYKSYMETNCTCTHDYIKQNQIQDFNSLDLDTLDLDSPNNNDKENNNTS